MKCDNCNRPATVHLTEIRNGKSIQKHLCEQCAQANEGIATPKAHQPINELLTNFVMAHSGAQKEMSAACEQCGVTWAEFRQTGLLGCEHDYLTFERELMPLLQRAHEGGNHHVGKTPARAAGGGPARSVDIARLRKDLAKAVEIEDYERAAKLRDLIRKAEEGQ